MKVKGPATILNGLGRGILTIPDAQLIFGDPLRRDRRPIAEMSPDELERLEARIDAEQAAHVFILFADSVLSDACLALYRFERVESEVQAVGNVDHLSRHERLLRRFDRDLALEQLRRLYSEAFIVASDMVAKIFERLIRATKAFPVFCCAIREEFNYLNDALPARPHLRDSIAHKDERSLGEARGKPIQPQMMDTSDYLGEQIHTGTLEGAVYRNTSSEGVQGELAITGTTFETVRKCVQRAVDALPWFRSRFISDPGNSMDPVRWQPGDGGRRNQNPFAYWIPK
ncbi:MAG TPA: hypothetical protein VGL59_22045 [Polyangia bacterium]